VAVSYHLFVLLVTYGKNWSCCGRPLQSSMSCQPLRSTSPSLNTFFVDTSVEGRASACQRSLNLLHAETKEQGPPISWLVIWPSSGHQLPNHLCVIPIYSSSLSSSESPSSLLSTAFSADRTDDLVSLAPEEIIQIDLLGSCER
jgi:hypothetical protein